MCGRLVVQQAIPMAPYDVITDRHEMCRNYAGRQNVSVSETAVAQFLDTVRRWIEGTNPENGSR
jgi:hypothetical protein